MDVREFDFDLPPHLIAQEPPAERTAARLLCVNRHSGVAAHSLVSALPDLLRAGDLLVVNNTRVFPARLIGRRVPSGGAVECLLVRRLLPDTRVGDTPGAELWEALVHPGQKLKPGARAVFQGSRTLHAEILERGFFGRRVIRLCADDSVSVEEAIDVLGHVPLPPYIKRQEAAADRDRYQTVFAWRRGSIAAPTAGLHFTPPLLDALTARGVARAEITLHVGYGTFQPVRVARVEDHRVEAEQYEIGPDAAEAITRASREGRRVIAVGTTTTRTLEAVARDHDGAIVPCSGLTDLFISPGFRFCVIGGLLTNFHLPRSSLLMLVSAFAGRDRVLAAYRTAVASGYRFYSYGDAMLIT
ncbi:MAG TPA: tRNA preQ1(34) S-adenosylmethionine ribosyltransferase-isomerase QueA [Vicinamibacterales bacterium]|jgi:S-adenosylmethionine:tRNA ribosyltransferase-isomerase|nr:tRNA preQ1(34) S-adenosylmethionine ribosyltransferase-isomerase QueA [Vicinamibacterales bacterium]